MPIIKLKSISSVSSEDPNHPATNLLSEDTYRKWQCATAGEKQLIIIIETEEASFFHSVDIGNNGCAFVEVLVGRSSGGDNYEVLLTASSFMSPAESKSWTNINRVRMFGRDKLSKLVLDQKWDKIKLVCTQPFNKIEKYGISFVKFHSPPSDEATPTEPDPTQKIGIFNLKPVSPVGGASDTVLFKKQPKSMAAKARLASAEAMKAEEEEGVLTTPPAPPSKSTMENPRKKPSNYKSPKDAPPNKKPKVAGGNVPHNQLLKGAIISLSGFQNPLRGELRELALSMGAEYKPDWDPTCTHLICAFQGTPKFNLVKSKNGLIVSKDWLLDCDKNKTRLPAKDYRFHSSKGGSQLDDMYDEREGEIFKETEEEEEVTTPQDDPYGGSTDDEGSDHMEYAEAKDDGYDTEDEIKRGQDHDTLRALQHDDSSEKQTSSDKPTRSLMDLPDFLSDCRFLLYRDYSVNDRRTISRYIAAYKGKIENYMSDVVTHVVSQDKWDENFDQAVAENSSLIFVKPQWIFACHSKSTKVPHQPYTIAPQ